MQFRGYNGNAHNSIFTVESLKQMRLGNNETSCIQSLKIVAIRMKYQISSVGSEHWKQLNCHFHFAIVI